MTRNPEREEELKAMAALLGLKTLTFEEWDDNEAVNEYGPLSAEVGFFSDEWTSDLHSVDIIKYKTIGNFYRAVERRLMKLARMRATL